ncbi:MAG: ABC transporter ATP-binding protein [Planctomycetota bacterium]|nr:MAG: ABC transporter ATP-binding protein [Planctomycetota bacterium]
MPTVRLAAESLCKRLRSGEREIEVLRDVNLEVFDGEFVAVLGPSGSGKSTLLGLLAGLDRPSSGSVRLDGQALESLNEDELALLRRHHVGFVFQSFLLLDNLTARENVLLPMDLAGTPNAAARADELLTEVGLAERGHHYPSQLSGGEQQRVALARAFGPRPALLLADEPTGNLDGATGRRVLDLIAALQAREGSTLVMVTHDAEVAARASRRIHMADGRIVREERGATTALAAEDAGPTEPAAENAHGDASAADRAPEARA